jgi:hypothetical protein
MNAICPCSAKKARMTLSLGSRMSLRDRRCIETKNVSGMVFKLQVVQHQTTETKDKVPVYRVVMHIVGMPSKKGRWSFISEDMNVFNEFPLGQEFTLTTVFEQQQIG